MTFAGESIQQDIFLNDFSCNQRRKLKNFDSLHFFLESLVKEIDRAL